MSTSHLERLLELAEQCDDGNDVDSDACPTSCQAATCGDGFVQEGEEECDDGNDVDDDACANDCTANNCLQDWMVGVFACNPMYGPCQDSETGYHWKGLYLYNNVQYACWWHTKNQGWNTTTETNFWHLADAFLLAKNAGMSRWCYPFAADPCQSGACAQGPDPSYYFDQPTSARGASVAAIPGRAAGSCASRRRWASPVSEPCRSGLRTVRQAPTPRTAP